MPKKAQDLTGQRFGRLTVIRTELRPESSGNRNRTFSFCKCDCGKETLVRNSTLKNKVRSCGCLGRENLVKVNKLRTIPDNHAIKTELYLEYKRTDKRSRYLEFNLEREEFVKFITSNCYYCGIEPNTRKVKRGQVFMWNGIDRIDSSKGYTKENCVTCCKDCNRAKWQMSQEEFKLFIKRAYEYMYGNLG